MRVVERQILLNQIAIMAGLKEHAIMTHGNLPAAARIARFDDAIKTTTELLRGQSVESQFT